MDEPLFKNFPAATIVGNFFYNAVLFKNAQKMFRIDIIHIIGTDVIMIKLACSLHLSSSNCCCQYISVISSNWFVILM